MHRALMGGVVLLASAGTAHAQDISMWGGGPRLGSGIIPLAYPVSFPKTVKDLDEDDDGTPDSSLEKVRFDLFLGGEGVVYIDNSSRIGLLATLGFGGGFSDTSIMAKYDVVLQKGTVDLLVGGGFGIGGMGFRGRADNTEEKLRVTYFPARLHTSAQFRNQGTQAYAVTLYGQLGIPGRHVYISPSGKELENVATVASVANYPTIGIEFTVMFGDFEPKEKSKKGKKGKGKKGK